MKVPLLEYLDKLEAEANGYIGKCSLTTECEYHALGNAPHRQILALTTKLREAVALLKTASIAMAIDAVALGEPEAKSVTNYNNAVGSVLEIEVPS